MKGVPNKVVEKHFMTETEAMRELRMYEIEEVREKNRKAPIGEIVSCPLCGEEFKKVGKRVFCGPKCKIDYGNKKI